MKSKILWMALTAVTLVNAAPPVEEGKTIFLTRCAGCHNINKMLTGPALAGVAERRSMDWIIQFVHSPQTMIKNGDKNAVALYNQYNQIPMPDHRDLSDEQIRNIIEYVKSESKPEEEKAPFVKPKKLRPDYTPLSFDDYGFFLTYFGIVALLVGVLLFAVQVKQYERSVSGKD